ncbi:pilus assembly protein PilP [Acinetobacter rudis]|uniref:pilus assembly protein PilP n=1 Tax=Acinetobacter rudis TaxID=632955 RepID=UPI00280CF882|nr:pilus assembly protein PilP [Acinetobacter rudis]MDQ8953056.1 pilus assembly protein PilP [Acinetobacter rudis]
MKIPLIEKIRRTFYALPLLISACSSQIDTVSHDLAEIHQLKLKNDVALYTFQPAPHFQYNAQHLRSPFVPSTVLTESALQKPLNLPSERSQPLALFSLESLLFKGSLRNATGEYVALVQTPEGDLEWVHRGATLGPNQAKVVHIDASKICLVEKKYDAKQGYIEVKKNIALSAK